MCAVELRDLRKILTVVRKAEIFRLSHLLQGFLVFRIFYCAFLKKKNDQFSRGNLLKRRNGKFAQLNETGGQIELH